MEKLCVFCVNMDEESWGSESMGDNESFVCRKHHFNGPATVYFTREIILKAETCPDYEQVKP